MVNVMVAVVLNWVAGFVDTVCYIALFHVFTANMTGNTLAAAIGVGEHRPELLYRRGLAVPAFLVGLFTSRLIVEFLSRRRVRSVAGLAYALEAALLAAFILIGDPLIGTSRQLSQEVGFTYYLLVFLPSMAMGVQNATLTHFGPLTARTTHVTGTLSEFAEQAVKYLFSLRLRSADHASLRKASLLIGIWLAYLLGGVAGVFLRKGLNLRSLWLTVAALVAVVAADAISPLKPGERRDS